MKIGIPRSLHYYQYAPFCITFFKEIGMEVILSSKTNKSMLHRGLSESINELCLPLKLLFGHVLDLQDKGVDLVFLPHVISPDRMTYICPRLIGSPDIIEASLDIPILRADIDMNNFYGTVFSSLQAVSRFELNPVKIAKAFRKAKSAQTHFDQLLRKDHGFESACSGALENKNPKRNATNQKIAVIGHPYVFNDDYISSNLIRRLGEYGYGVVTSDSIPQKKIISLLKAFERIPHWSLGNRVLAGAVKFSRDSSIKGIIYITPFGCSSDSLVKEYMEYGIKHTKPVMTITVDEHSGDAGVITRIEAFLDMIQ